MHGRRGSHYRLSAVSARFAFEVDRDATAARDADACILPHGVVETPAFMPVGTRGAIKGADDRSVDALGADIILANTYHLHLRPGDDLHRARRRAARVHGMATADSHRLGRLSGLHRSPSAGRISEDGRRLSIAPRRTAALAHARVGRRHPGAARLGHRDDVRRVSELAGDARRDRGGDGAHAAVGAARPRSLSRGLATARAPTSPRPTPGQAQFGIIQGGTYKDLRDRSVAGTRRGRLRGLRDRRPVGRRAGRRHVRRRRRTPPRQLPEDRPRYLMGTGMPTTWSRASRAASTCSTACCRPGTPGTASSSPGAGRSPSRTPGMPRICARPTPTAPVRPAGVIQPGVSAPPFHGRRDERRPPLTRCIICTFTLTPCGRLGRLLSSEPSSRSGRAFLETYSRRQPAPQ